MAAQVWTVPATVVRVVDGDTLELDLDLGWHITYRAKLRLAGVNAPEMSTPPGPFARQFVVDQLTASATQPGWWIPVTVVSHSLDKYGRVLGSISWADQAGTAHDLAAELLAAGHAVPMK